MKKLNIFDQNHGLTPQETSNLATGQNLYFDSFRKTCFLSIQNIKKIFSKHFFAQKQEKILKFLTKTMD